MKNNRGTVWQSAWDAWLGCFHFFFGPFPAFLNQRWRLREVGLEIFSGMTSNNAQAYYFPITGIEDAEVVRSILNQGMNAFFLRNGISIASHGEEVVSFRSTSHPGEVARLRIVKQGWQLIVPSNFFAGPTYAEMEKKWDGMAVEMVRILSDRYA